ncbi:hypothetical protein ACRDU6_00215 (plasmid) [Mycolicibacterium sp. ELW1]|uniref:hypothetical protein n=1 Tax=Mycobacteriaceae TaxID=1762 RepID=UPI0011EFE4A1|nr:hypothetical protein [Mycobacterium sp. ELW1]QEN17590.1 hypothetical protein D3H54_30425 [Mycobacterium sp. ELW1]
MSSANPHTARENTAFNIRRDARYALDWVEKQQNLPDTPTKPAAVAAAWRFIQWCADTNTQLLTDPQPDVDDVVAQWRREAVASDICVIPETRHLCGLVAVGAAMYATGAIVFGSYLLAALILTCAALLAVYRVTATPRLAVGPDAKHTNVAHTADTYRERHM